jgi:hydrogenase maturation protease
VRDPSGSARALVLGIGNPLMSDDGVGLRVLEVLAGLAPALDGVRYLDAGTLGFLLLPDIEDSDSLLLLDAARLGAAPGELRVFEGSAMDEFLAGNSAGVHDVSLRDMLDAARLTGGLPERRALVAVQPGKVDWGLSLSAAVESAVIPAAMRAREILERW